MTTKRPVLALCGLSGAGKSFVLEQLKPNLEFTHLSAGTLIGNALQANHQCVSHDALRYENIGLNQSALIQGFHDHACQCDGVIVLDCHTIIDTGHGIEEIAVEVFRQIGVTEFYFLSVPIPELQRRRLADSSRDRPQHPDNILEEHQRLAAEAARNAAEAIGASFFDIGEAPNDLLREAITKALSAA